jgi:hypothetical protein
LLSNATCAATAWEHKILNPDLYAYHRLQRLEILDCAGLRDDQVHRFFKLIRAGWPPRVERRFQHLYVPAVFDSPWTTCNMITCDKMVHYGNDGYMILDGNYEHGDIWTQTE